MSRWSISATSPRTRCLTSSFVRRPGRTGPLTSGVSDLALGAGTLAGGADARERWIALRPPARVTPAGRKRACRIAALRRRGAARWRACARRCRRCRRRACARARRRRRPRRAAARSCASARRRVSLTIEKWRAPSEAICGRWVMQSTCLRSPSSRRRAPTTRAVWPPMPASTSSNTSVVSRAEALRDAHDREHHPRELAAGGDLPQRAGGHAGVGRDRELDACPPPEGPGSRSPRSTSKLAAPMASDSSCSRTAARSAARRPRAPCAPPSTPSQRRARRWSSAPACSSATSAPASSSWRARARSAYSSTARDAAAVLAGEPLDRAEALFERLQGDAPLRACEHALQTARGGALAVVAQLAGEILGLDQQRAQALGERVERGVDARRAPRARPTAPASSCDDPGRPRRLRPRAPPRPRRPRPSRGRRGCACARARASSCSCSRSSGAARRSRRARTRAGRARARVRWRARAGAPSALERARRARTRPRRRAGVARGRRRRGRRGSPAVRPRASACDARAGRRRRAARRRSRAAQPTLAERPPR